MHENERYNRQEILWGKDGQTKLSKARVAVIGLDYQGAYASLCLSALGIGNIVLIDGNSCDEMFLDMRLKGQSVEEYADALKRINSQINIEGYPTNLEGRIDQLALERCDVIIDATNSVRSKQLAISYGLENKIPVLSSSSMYGYTKLMLCNEPQNPANLMSQFNGRNQDPLMALVMSGLIAEEARKLIFNEKNTLKDPVRYSLSDSRYGFPEKEIPHFNPDVYKNLKIAFLGGGALGCWAAIAASQLGFGRIDIYDYDVFESHNINRQILGYDGIDKLKASHIASKIEAMTQGRTNSKGYNVLILPGFDTAENYDLVFDFVDNRYTRAINTSYARVRGIPMISAGAQPYSARWDAHVKSKTKCPDCLFNIFEEGRKEEMIRRASCAANPNPSVVMSNSIAAVAAVLESLTVFEPDKFGKPFNGEQTYRSTAPTRFGTTPLKGSCECYSKRPPRLEISQEEVEKFAKENPQLLRNE